MKIMERNYYSLYLQTAKLLNEAVEPKTITFASGSTICWDEISDMHCDALQGCQE